MQNYENLCFAAEEDLAVVTLNRPNRRNALSLDLMMELIDCLEQIGRSRTLRAVLTNSRARCRAVSCMPTRTIPP
jgi:enoyl-CoA hydratase/carnithine racemase